MNTEQHDELKDELLNMRRRMRRLTATNMVLAVVVLAFGGAGAAYALAAANSVNSASIIDGTIVTPDLKVGSIAGSRLLNNGITGAKIYPDTLTGADIKESTLNLPAGSSPVVASSSPPDTTQPAFGDAGSDGVTIASATFTVSTPGFYSVRGSLNFARYGGTCDGFPDYVGQGNTWMDDKVLNQRLLGPFSNSGVDGPAIWLDSGQHTARIEYVDSPCDGTVDPGHIDFSNIHLQVNR